MKRAFSLVEIVVVLLIIGIVCGILIKGKETMDATGIRAEVNKIEKIRNAVASMMSYTNGYSSNLEREGNTDALSLQPFYRLDLLTEDDLKVYGSNFDWRIRLCSISIETDVNTGENHILHDYDIAFKSICAYNEHYYLDLTCNAEFVLDDQSTNSGFGISFAAGSGGGSANTPEGYFGVKGAYNCDNVSAFQSASGVNVAGTSLPAYSFQEYK